jgi:predicted signal transduction protein with EAL and GGDEF domain
MANSSPPILASMASAGTRFCSALAIWRIRASPTSAFAWAALELLKAPVALSKRKIYIGASIGIASGTPAEIIS